MVFTSVAGHVTEMDFGEGYRKWNSCQPSALFDAPIEVKVNKVYRLNLCF